MEKYINYCLKLAYKNALKSELPISAIIVRNNKIISKAANRKNLDNNVLKHAEIIAIQKASKKLKRWNLNDCIMIVTLRPCKMCEYVIRESRIKKVYYLLEKLEYKKTYKNTDFILIQNHDLKK